MSDSLPSVTSNIPRDLRTFIDRVRDTLGAGGARRIVTVDQLARLGLATINAQGSPVPVESSASFFVTPPAPTNVSATAAIQNIIVEWDSPAYSGHSYAEVWVADVNDIGQAVLLGSAPGGIYVDSVGPSITRYYWVRFVNVEDTKGPYNALTGVTATTGTDLAYVMGVLSDALGSTSEAPFFQIDQATEIDGLTIPAGTYIKSAFIFDGAITNAKIGTAAIDDAKIANLSAAKITTGTLSADRIATGSLDAKIANIDAAIITSGFIDTARIADATITAAKIADATITAAKIADATITAAKIADATITAANIVDATITAAKIANTTITAAKIADATITAAKIADATITTAKIGTAQVDTLQLAGQAVTIPVSVFVTAGVSFGTSTVTIGTAEIASTGAPTVVTFSCSHQHFISDGGVSRWNILVLRGGTTIYSSQVLSQSVPTLLSLVCADMTPPVGTNTYTIQAYLNSLSAGRNVTASQRTFYLLETKR